MLRKSVAIFTVFALIFGVAGLAMAADRVEVKVTSEPIPDGSPCSKAGGFSLEFDEGTTLEVGDQITIDTQFATSLCRDFDMIISPANDIILDANGNYLSGTLWTDANTQSPGSNTGAAFTQTVATMASNPAALPPTNTIVLGDDPAIANQGVVFRVRGIAGSQRITISVLGSVVRDANGDITNRASIRVNNTDPQQPEVVTQNFLDERTNTLASVNPPSPIGPTFWPTPSIWEVGTVLDNPLRTVYDDSADWNNNTLCIDVSSEQFLGSTVNGNMDSRNDKFTFIPSNPQIAHIAAEFNVELFECKNVATAAGNIVIPDEQGSSAFDYEMGTGYCTPGDLGRRIIFQNLSDFFDTNRQYSIRAEILSPSNFVYWGTGGVGYQGQRTPDCDTTQEGTLPVASAFNRNGALLENFTGDTGTGTVADAQKAVVIETGSAQVFTAADSRALYVNLPNMVFDKDSVLPGTEVRVRVTLQTFPCGTISTQEISLGVFGCEAGGGGDDARNTMVYPYFTALDSEASGWWNGIVVSNLGTTDGTATFFLYEADGDRATLELPVPANGQIVALLEDTLDAMTVTNEVNGIGNSSSYIVVCTDFMADGFAMIANNQADTVNGSESMGYLPRFERALNVCNQ